MYFGQWEAPPCVDSRVSSVVVGSEPVVGRPGARHVLLCREFTAALELTKTAVLWVKVNKGKSVPLQARSGPEGSRKLRFPDFMTTAQEGGKVVSLTHRPHLPPGNFPGTRFC